MPNKLVNRATTKKTRKLFIRWGILAANVGVLAAVLFFVLNASSSSSPKTSLATGTAATVGPVDEVSSADIAVHVARLVNLYEKSSVANNADSLNAQMAIASGEETILSKPQIAATDTKTKLDIVRYVTVDGDTISNLATKFGVTSDSIKWSNSLTGNTLAAGKELYIPPRNGIVYTVKTGDTPESLATKFRANKDQIIVFNDAEISGLVAGQRIVIPDGSVQAVATTTYSGFSFGASAIYGFNGYDYGWCTWYAANRRAQLGNPVPSNLGNAYSWYILAQRAGLPTGTVPQVGAVAVNQGGNHVSVVEQVNPDGSFWISEMNSRGQVSITDPTPAGGWNRLDYKLVTSVGNLKFIY
ncbi:MAG: LysM peptidoglycan-binding domain-containing protein [Candidatus Saccharibacteria bacterium]|nr:LysM peptidoglycan-binding domain-containing protein [Candidatus Saccharibacteria bacterium]